MVARPVVAAAWDTAVASVACSCGGLRQLQRHERQDVRRGRRDGLLDARDYDTQLLIGTLEAHQAREGSWGTFRTKDRPGGELAAVRGCPTSRRRAAIGDPGKGPKSESWDHCLQLADKQPAKCEVAHTLPPLARGTRTGTGTNRLLEPGGVHGTKTS